MPLMKLPRILETPLDPNGDLELQALSRLREIAHFYRCPLPPNGDVPPLMWRLAFEAFPRAFETKAPVSDQRCQVSNPDRLRTLVYGLKDDTSFADPGLTKVAKNVRKYLADRNRKISLYGICEALSKVPESEWKGVKPETIRSNLYDPKADPARRSAKILQETLLEQLGRSFK